MTDNGMAKLLDCRKYWENRFPELKHLVPETDKFYLNEIHPNKYTGEGVTTAQDILDIIEHRKSLIPPDVEAQRREQEKFTKFYKRYNKQSTIGYYSSLVGTAIGIVGYGMHDSTLLVCGMSLAVVPWLYLFILDKTRKRFIKVDIDKMPVKMDFLTLLIIVGFFIFSFGLSLAAASAFLIWYKGWSYDTYLYVGLGCIALPVFAIIVGSAKKYGV